MKFRTQKQIWVQCVSSSQLCQHFRVTYLSDGQDIVYKNYKANWDSWLMISEMTWTRVRCLYMRHDTSVMTWVWFYTDTCFSGVDTEIQRKKFICEMPKFFK